MSGGALWRELRSLANRQQAGSWTLPADQRQEIVAHAVEELPESAKLLLALRYYEGLGVEELSDALDLRTDEVSRQITTAVSEVYDLLMQAERAERGEGPR